MARVVPRPEPPPAALLLGVARGLALTLGHAVRSVADPVGLRTLPYPEVPAELPADRGRHRLMKRPDGTPRCVACYMCATACPANCIYISAEESPDRAVEKRPSSFSIDTLRCVFCGFCAEACPCDAIRMDTRRIEPCREDRESFVRDLADLLSWNPADFPGDRQSQLAPGGTLNAQALAAERAARDGKEPA